MGTLATFTVYVSRHQTSAGLSLRGSCHGVEAAQQLEQALAEVLAAGPSFIWVDCRYLVFLGWHGQRTIFNAHQLARRAHCMLHWCGFSASVLGQLADSGLHLLLHTLPAGSYQGPSVLLPEALPARLGRHTYE